MSAEPQKLYRVWVLRRTFKLFAACLVLSAIVAALCGDRLHMVYALCACGSVSVLAGWLAYLRMTGSRIPEINPQKLLKRIPFMLRKPGQTKLRKPAFMMDGNDFDDDLTDKTAVNSELFTEVQAQKAQVISRAAAGALLYIVSLFIHA